MLLEMTLYIVKCFRWEMTVNKQITLADLNFTIACSRDANERCHKKVGALEVKIFPDAPGHKTLSRYLGPWSPLMVIISWAWWVG